MNHSEFGKLCAAVSVNLFEKLLAAESKEENILVSPLSIQTCMALAFNGAKGETAKEIATAMGYDSYNPDEVAETFNHVLKEYEGSDLVKIANKVYLQEGKNLRAHFIKVIKEKYHADADVVDFQQKEEAAEHMNSWVENKTNGKIKNLIAPSALEDDTYFILLNALHFKGQWRDQFDPKDTNEGDFWINNEQSVKVDFMFQDEKFKYGYYGDLKCSGLEMPYAGSDLSMFVLLPNERDGLRELAQKMKDVNLSDLAKEMHEMYAYVRFPKFKIDYAVEMTKVLKEMGITTAFRDDADFSNIMESGENICISKVFHKASIEVNEAGTEAAAATAMVPRPCCMPPEFVADHPFLYFIWDKNHVILFAGAFVKAPEKTE